MGRYIWCIHSLDWTGMLEWTTGMEYMEWPNILKIALYHGCFSLLNKQNISFSSTSLLNYSTVYSDHPLAMPPARITGR